MHPKRSPATPDLMALLCLIGGVVREAGETNLLMQVLVIANLCPEIQHALLAWLATEERYAGLEFEEEPGVVEDGWGGPDGYYRGFMTPKGRVVLWRHVTRFGLAVMVPVVTGVYVRPSIPAVAAHVAPRTLWLASLSFFHIFLPTLPVAKNCVLFVPVS